MSSLLPLFLRGLVMGFAIAAPVGAIGVLCIRRTLAYGRGVGLATGLGAATADGVYGAIAAFGVTALSAALLSARAWLGLAGGLFLVYLGIRTITAKVSADGGEPLAPTSLWGAYGSTFLLTLGNPMTILSFTAAFAALGVGAAGAGVPGALAIVIGVFLGSAAWWLVLSTGVGFVRHMISDAAMVWIDRVSGALIVAFGTLAAYGAIVQLGLFGRVGR